MSHLRDHQRACGHGEQPQGVQTRVVTATSSTGISIQAGAEAFGENTLADTQVLVATLNRGLACFSTATIYTLAAAQSADGSPTLASAYAITDVLNADLSITYRETGSGEDLTGATSQQASASVIAVSFAFDTGHSPIHMSYDVATEACTSGIGTLNGNLASFGAEVGAYGENSFVDLQVDAIALQGQYSSSIVSAASAIDSVVVYTEYSGTRGCDRITTGDMDALVRAGRGGDVVHAGDGADWLFGQDGDDWLFGGGGDDTLFGGDDDDRVAGGDGDDWLFGGEGGDQLEGNDGDDLLLGGDGKDRIAGGAGCDLIDGGDGRDFLSGGAGGDIFRIGAPNGDGDDCYRGGSGGDTYLVVGQFDDDTIQDFSISENDRLAIADLDGLIDAGAISMARSSCDRDDLVIKMHIDGECSTLVLDEFFSQNSGFRAMPTRGEFTQQQVTTLMHAIAVDANTEPALDAAAVTFQFGDILSVFG